MTFGDSPVWDSLSHRNPPILFLAFIPRNMAYFNMSEQNKILWPIHVQEGLQNVQEQNDRAIFNRKLREARKKEREKWEKNLEKWENAPHTEKLSKKEMEMKALQHFKKGPNMKYPKWPSGSGRKMRYLVAHPYR